MGSPSTGMSPSSIIARKRDGYALTRGEIAAFVRNAIDDVTTVHHGHMPEIEVLSPTRATGVWAMEDMLRWPDGAPIRSLHGYGHYHETYERIDGQWRIKTMRLSYLRMDVSASTIAPGRR